MKENYKKTILVMVIFIVVVSSILFANRYFYGSFNVLSNPVRLVYEGVHYNHRSSPKILTLKDEPMIEVSRIFDVITGKKLFAKDRNFVGPGKTIYLYLGGDKYISYTSGGGG